MGPTIISSQESLGILALVGLFLLDELLQRKLQTSFRKIRRCRTLSREVLMLESIYTMRNDRMKDKI